MTQSVTVAALAHFCDNHGPRAVMCTQVAADRRSLPGARSLPAAGRGACAGTPKRKMCAACHSVPEDVRCFSSVDPETGLAFVSCNASAFNPELERRLRTASSRSLSVEEPSAEGREVFFSDEGVAFSKCFKVADPAHRGGKRTYCLLVLSADRPRLMTSSAVVAEKANEIILELRRSAAESAAAADHQTEVLCDEAGRRVTFPPQKNLTEITCPEVFQKIHYSFADILCNVVNVQRSLPRVDTRRSAGSVRNLALVLGRDDLLTLISGLLSGVPVEVVAPRRADLVCFTEALNGCLPEGFPIPLPNEFGVSDSGSYRTLYFSHCSGEQPGRLTVRFPSEGVDGTNVAVECSEAIVVSALGKRVVHYIWNNEASCEEFVAAGIRSALREYRSLGAAHAASGGGGRLAGAAARFCRAVGLSERDQNTLEFFARLSRLTGNF